MPGEEDRTQAIKRPIHRLPPWIDASQPRKDRGDSRDLIGIPREHLEGPKQAGMRAPRQESPFVEDRADCSPITLEQVLEGCQQRARCGLHQNWQLAL